jgi:hypothetical protein
MYSKSTTQKMEKKNARRSIVYAFLPLGSLPSADTHYVRLGYHACKHSDGTRARLATRFHGLNRVRELLLMIEVNTTDVHQHLDHIQIVLSGPCTVSGVVIKNHTTFENAYRLGQAWRMTGLPLADVRTVFQHISDRQCEGASTISHLSRRIRDNLGLVELLKTRRLCVSSRSDGSGPSGPEI